MVSQQRKHGFTVPSLSTRKRNFRLLVVSGHFVYVSMLFVWLRIDSCDSFALKATTGIAGDYMTTTTIENRILSAAACRERRPRYDTCLNAESLPRKTGQSKQRVSKLSVSAAPSVEAKEPPKAIPKKRRKSVPEEFKLELTMMNHELLTKDQEQNLATILQRSRKLQLQIDSLVAERKLKAAANEYDTLMNRRNEDTDFAEYRGDDGYDWADVAYQRSKREISTSSLQGGSSHRREYDAVVAEYGWHPSSFEAKSSLLERLDQKSRSTQASWFLDDQGVATFESSTTEAWTTTDRENYVTFPLDQSGLSDHDIVHSLGLPGGRKEMQTILLQGSRARDILIRSNFKLVSSICKRWSRMSAGRDTESMFSIYNGGWDRPSLSEAVQEGVIGLVVAAERFNPERGLRFSTYATYWITNSVRQCFQRATTGCLRLPINYYDTKTRYKTLLKEYYERDGKVPSISVLAQDMGMTESRLELMLRLTQPLLSTDGLLKPMGITKAGKAGNVNRMEDNIPISETLVEDREMNPEDLVELSLLRRNLEHAMATELLPFERDVLRLRLGLDDGVIRTCREVSQECGGVLSSMEVRTTEQRALKKLRSPVALATYKLLAFLDFAEIDRETVRIR